MNDNHVCTICNCDYSDDEVSEVEYKKLEQEALEYNEKLASDKAELDAPAKRKKKSSTF